MKLSIVMIAVVLGSIGAVASKAASPKSTVGDPSYYWFDASNNYTGNDDTKSTEKTVSGCNDTHTTICENGYTVDQLVNGDPNQGVKPMETPASTIKRSN